MKLVLSDSDKISKFSILFQHLKAITEHVVLYMNSGGVHMQGMDPSHCTCFEVRLTSQWFDTFEYDQDKDITSLGISTNVLHKIIGTKKETQSLTIGVLEDENNLNVSLTGGDNVLDKYFEIPLMDIEQELFELNNEDSDVDLIMTSKNFSELVSQLQMFNDRLTMTFTEETVSMVSNGLDGSMKVNISFDDVIEYTVEEKIQLKQSYSLKFVSMMCQFSKLSEEFAMAFSKDRPMYGRYNLDDKNSFVSFYLAPKVEDD